MVKMQVIYEGEKHCELKHDQSGTKIFTDAPKDNQGKGEAFSPTDLCAVSLASCILTTMAIRFEGEGVHFENAKAYVEKHMVSEPRRIGKIVIQLELPKSIPGNIRDQVEKVGQTCPVHHSLHPDIQKEIVFRYTV